MSFSFEGIGGWAATFACSEVQNDIVVKITDNGKVGTCAAGDAFCGQVISVDGDGTACAVALGGMVTASYTGTAPAVGFVGLSANGNGGVKGDTNGRSRLVTAVDTAAKTVTFVL